jgi:hypothetical protein
MNRPYRNISELPKRRFYSTARVMNLSPSDQHMRRSGPRWATVYMPITDPAALQFGGFRFSWWNGLRALPNLVFSESCRQSPTLPPTPYLI